MWVELSDAVERAVIDTGTPESEAPSMALHLDVKTGKKASGKGPYPEFVEVVRENPSRTRREARRAQAGFEVEGRRDALEAALLPENSRRGRVGTVDRAQVLRLACLDSEGCAAKGVGVLSRKQAKGARFRWPAWS